jgi:hypothetical protein
VDRFGLSTDLDPAGLPRWQHVVDDDGRPSGGRDVAELLGRREVSPGDRDGLPIGVQSPADRRDVRHAVRSDRGEPAEQAFAPQVAQFLVGEDAHRSPSLIPVPWCPGLLACRNGVLQAPH